jgi:hypothetical protein
MKAKPTGHSVTQGFQLRTPWLRDRMELEGMRVHRAGWAQGKDVGYSAEQEVEVGSRDGAMTVQSDRSDAFAAQRPDKEDASLAVGPGAGGTWHENPPS